MPLRGRGKFKERCSGVVRIEIGIAYFQKCIWIDNCHWLYDGREKEKIALMDRGRVCILSFSPVFRDARVLRQIEYASREYDVDVIGHGQWTPKWPRVRFQEVRKAVSERKLKNLQSFILLFGGRIVPSLWMKAYWWQSDCRDALKILLRNEYSIIHANDLKALPAAVVAASQCGGKVLFDAHEYYPGQAKYSSRKMQFLYSGYVDYLLRKCGPRADAFVTVSRGLADVYKKEFNLQGEVIMNAPPRAEVPFRPVEPGRIRLIYHGRATPQRQPEKLIEMIDLLPERFTLHLMVIGDREGYVQKLVELAGRRSSGRVVIQEPVEPSMVVETLAKFDIGVYSLPPLVLNSRLALQNKLFDFCAAGLAVVIGPSPEMTRVVKKYGFGIVADGFEGEDLARALKDLSVEQINRMKLEAIKASQLLNADLEMAKLMKIYRKVLKGNEGKLAGH